MTELVDPTQIEQIVGTTRHRSRHYGRAVASEDRLYILHSQQCLDKFDDLRECPYSQALDRGQVWAPLDHVVQLSFENGRLFCTPAPEATDE